MTNIKIDYKALLKNHLEFEDKLQQNIQELANLSTSLFDIKEAQEKTSYQYWQSIKDKNLNVANHKNLIDFKKQDLNRNLIRFLMEMFPGHAINPSGHFWYPPGGYMSWHTNSDESCLRVYISVVDTVMKSSFNFIKNQEFYQDWDDQPIIVRKFFCGNDQDPFWHSVYSECNRYSFGYRLY